MTPERWQRVKDVFDQVIECDDDSRLAVLQDCCGIDDELRREVESLLASDGNTGSALEPPVAAAAFHSSGAAAAPARALVSIVGQMMGPYRIIREIGRGGMGSVYLAERADDQFRRRVAVKVVNPELVDTHTVRRFENERQMLAALDHPNIIKLIDGGTSESGLPWLATEYVEGQTIERFCETRNLTLRERLQLFRDVCAAVHYAHQNLVIHRDLKPANILVTPDGAAKLLDFGIARLLRPEYSLRTVGYTRTEFQPMTPEYASPEQLRGLPITTATDIYSLGVLLYRLVTGQHPYQPAADSLLALEHAICESEPVKPSMVARQRHEPSPASAAPAGNLLSADLDTIVLMAMRKEPQRRYASAQHLAEDVRRLLENRPVLARGEAWTYRLGKFVSRNRAGTALGVAATTALCVLGFIAQKEYRQAQRRAHELRQFASVVLNMDDAQRTSVSETRATMLGKAIESLDNLARGARDNPDLQQDLLRAYLNMADLQGNKYAANLGRVTDAEETTQKALALAEDIQRRDPANKAAVGNVLQCYTKLGDLQQTRADYRAALAQYRGAQDASRRLADAEPSNPEALKQLVLINTRIGDVQYRLGDPAAARDSFISCLPTMEKWIALEPARRSTLAFIKERAAYYAMQSGENIDVEPAILEAVNLYREMAGPNPSPTALRNIVRAHHVLAEVRQKAGKLPDAAASLQTAHRITEDLLQRDPKNAQFRNDLTYGMMLSIELSLQTGQRQIARRLTHEALSVLELLVAAPDASEDALYQYARILTQTPFPDLQNHPDALRCARRLTQSNPEYLRLVARACSNSGDTTGAAESLKKALTLFPAVASGRPVPELRRRIEEDLAQLSR